METLARSFALLLCLLLAACAGVPATHAPDALFDDRGFAASSERIRAEDVFALSTEMRRYIATEIADRTPIGRRRQALFDALYSKAQLKLDYDSEMTRNAAQAFAARSGNCLSLVIMTAAFAKELDLPVHYQTAYLDDTWSRSGGIEFISGHVNLSLGRSFADPGAKRPEVDRMTIDFLPPAQGRALRTREVSEATIVAMYMNNKAAESLARGRVDDAYWWARAAIEQDPQFTSAYNTLGAVYQRHGDLRNAEAALAYALGREPANTNAMSNLANVLRAQGRLAEAEALAQKVAQLEPNPPFASFRRGVIAMKKRDFKRAEALFAEEVDREPYYDEFRYWLAAAYIGLGDLEEARKQLDLAIEYSTDRSTRGLYAAKLARINAALHPQ